MDDSLSERQRMTLALERLQDLLPTHVLTDFSQWLDRNFDLEAGQTLATLSLNSNSNRRPPA